MVPVTVKQLQELLYKYSPDTIVLIDISAEFHDDEVCAIELNGLMWLPNEVPDDYPLFVGGYNLRAGELDKQSRFIILG